MRLSKYKPQPNIAGRSLWVVIFWYCLNNGLLRSWLPGSGWRKLLLRAFGASVGGAVVIKPRISVKYPWKLKVGNHSWIGEGVWIDNVASVEIGANVCVSQAVYMCSGSHDWSKETFDLRLGPIVVEDYAWICAKASLAPGSHIGQGGVVGFGVVHSGILRKWTIVCSSKSDCWRHRAPTFSK